MFKSLSAPTGCKGAWERGAWAVLGVLREFHQQLPMDKEGKSQSLLGGDSQELLQGAAPQ